jgi:hypothetical protein
VRYVESRASPSFKKNVSIQINETTYCLRTVMDMELVAEVFGAIAHVLASVDVEVLLLFVSDFE